MRVLVIDDNKDLLDTIASYLGDEDKKNLIEKASSYQDGLEKITTNSKGIDLVICDINLGEKTGIELVSKIRSKNIMTPVILISGDPNREEMISEAKKQDYNLYAIGKPFEMFKLEAEIKQVIKNKTSCGVEGIIISQDLARKDSYPRKKRGQENTAWTTKYIVTVSDPKKRGLRKIRTSPSIISESKNPTICPDVQIGCSLGCKFCRSWKKYKAGEKIISLTATEIYQQVEAVAKANNLKKKAFTVALVGGGSCEKNYKETLLAIQKMALHFKRVKSFIVSTPGDKDFIANLSRDVESLGLPVTLNWSLTCLDDKERKHLMPSSDKIQEVVWALKKFSGKTRINHIVRKGSDPKELYDFLSRWGLLDISIRLSYPIPGGDLSLEEISQEEMFFYLGKLKELGVKSLVEAINPSYRKRQTLEIKKGGESPLLTKRVAIFEDDEALSDLLREYLNLLGCEANVNPTENPKGFNFAIVDYGMSGRSQIIAKLEESATKIIIISGGDIPENFKRQLEKPFRLQQLQNLLI